MDVSTKQKEVLTRFPATRREIAEDLDISLRAVRYRMNALEEKGYDFSRDSDGVWSYHNGEEWSEEGIEQEKELMEEKEREEEEPWRVNSYEKAQATKEVHNTLTEIEKEIKEALNNTSPINSSYELSEGHSTLVIPRTDDHFGAKVSDRSINDEFTTEIAKERVNKVIDDAVREAKERGDVEEVILGLFGDHVEGENIYPNQNAKLDEFLREQIREASTTYVKQIEKLSEEFDNVKVVTCPGNHGRTSGLTNADDIVFDQIEIGLQWLDVENVEFVSSNKAYVEFDIREHDAYARHGQDALKHASTSSGDDRWLNWKEESNFDVAYHGHHHELRLEPVGYSQVFQCGTIVPPSLFVNSIGATGIPRAFYHFSTDENIVDQMKILEF